MHQLQLVMIAMKPIDSVLGDVKVQRELQLQIEKHGKFLKKLIEEQNKAGSSNSSSSSLIPKSLQCFQSADITTLLENGSCSTHLPKRKASQCTESEEHCERRHGGESSTKPDRIPV